MTMKKFDKKEALEILSTELEVFRKNSYTQLRSMINSEPFTKEIKLASNKWYQVEIQAFWDHKKNDNIRVIASIGNGGFRSLLPINLDFIIRPDGTFVGE